MVSIVNLQDKNQFDNRVEYVQCNPAVLILTASLMDLVGSERCFGGYLSLLASFAPANLDNWVRPST
jgi:hypothetical protein